MQARRNQSGRSGHGPTKILVKPTFILLDLSLLPECWSFCAGRGSIAHSRNDLDSSTPGSPPPHGSTHYSLNTRYAKKWRTTCHKLPEATRNALRERKIQNFPGGACLQTPLARRASHAKRSFTVLQPPQILRSSAAAALVWKSPTNLNCFRRACLATTATGYDVTAT